MNKKVLYISYDGMTDPLGQSQVLPYIIGLTKYGYRFHLISFEKPERLAKEGDLIRKITSDNQITWVPLTFTSKPPVLSKVYDRWNLRRTSLRLQRKEHFDIVHCRSYVAAEIGLLLKRKFGTKFLFDMRGFWADEKVDSGHWNQRNLLFRYIYRHFKNRERDFLLMSDAIISLTEAAVKELHRNKLYEKLKIDVIPCCADLTHFNLERISPSEITNTREELGIEEGKKVITYLGSIGGWYMVKEMFEFFRTLQEEDNNFLMLILTKDPPESVYQQAALQGIASDSMVVRYAPRAILPRYLSVSECSIFFIKPTYSKIASSPTKHAELMGMGIPVICNTIGDTGWIIEKTQTGLIVDEFSHHSYKESLRSLPSLLSIDRRAIRQAALDYFDLENGIKAYEKVYRTMENDR